jgi:hypothetical protein
MTTDTTDIDSLLASRQKAADTTATALCRPPPSVGPDEKREWESLVSPGRRVMPQFLVFGPHPLAPTKFGRCAELGPVRLPRRLGPSLPSQPLRRAQSPKHSTAILVTTCLRGASFMRGIPRAEPIVGGGDSASAAIIDMDHWRTMPLHEIRPTLDRGQIDGRGATCNANFETKPRFYGSCRNGW